MEEAMATVTVSSVVDAPVDRVFQGFTDIEHGPEHVADIKLVEIDDGPGSARHALA